ncbi:outer membrane beta-barrel protein [Pedobacter sp. L105]|uniref:outer membrane beta-barrel protein n=1 Tax=Pedobacter sp. L105 TaxID=1641871 RepID=UPI00131ECE6C|nr:outer membrane beta-barrel protein [Pedobacter sp. L105]
MKRILFTLLIIGMVSTISQKGNAQQDTTAVKKKRHNLNLHTTFGDNEEKKISHQDTTKHPSAPKGRFLGGITFTRLDIGYSRLIDNGSFTLSPKNSFLDYRGAKTSTVSFDVLYFGYRFNPNFKVYLAGGFDWTLIRLKNNITIQENTPDLTYVESPVAFSKNRFSSSYVHIPLNFEFRSKENAKGKRFYFVLGPEVSFLLNGKVKQISDENGKQKFTDDYDFQPVRIGGTVRIGYGGIGLFTKYYFNNMFNSAPQSGLKNMAFGITFGLN